MLRQVLIFSLTASLVAGISWLAWGFFWPAVAWVGLIFGAELACQFVVDWFTRQLDDIRIS